MSNAANIALTAINAFDKNLSIIANNIANVNTDGFKKSRAVMEGKETSGVSVTPEQVNTPGDMVTISGVARETSIGCSPPLKPNTAQYRTVVCILSPV